MFWKIQEILYSMGTEIFEIGPVKAEKIGFKVINLNSEVIAIVWRVGHFKLSFLCHFLSQSQSFSAHWKAYAKTIPKQPLHLRITQKMKVLWPFKHQPFFKREIMVIKLGVGDDFRV